MPSTRMVNFDQCGQDGSGLTCHVRFFRTVFQFVTRRVLFVYVSLKHLFKLGLKQGWRGFFGTVEPCEQSCTASGADPGNVAFAVGADLANVAQKGVRPIGSNREKAYPDEQRERFPYYVSKPNRVFFRSPRFFSASPMAARSA